MPKLLDAHGGRTLALESVAAEPVENYQGATIPPHELNMFPEFERRFGTDTEIVRRTGPTARFNCHGMCLASRRTAVEQTPTVRRVLSEDGYDEIQDRALVLAGDLVLYLADDGDVEHSAIVVSPPAASPMGIPQVLSKWGRWIEAVHPANKCPYNFANARYYRMRSP